jgi:peptide deformylase
LIEDMFASMYLANGVGLAAVQIGVPLAVFVYDCPDEDEVQHKGHLINPVIASVSKDVEKGEEGCLSVPGPFAVLARPEEVTVRGVDRHGESVELTGTGYYARCLLHETEHLQGTLYIDHLNRRQSSRVIAEMQPASWNAPIRSQAPAMRGDDGSDPEPACSR